MDTPAREFLSEKAGSVTDDYRRPPPPILTPASKSLIFMQTDADYTLMPNDVPVIRLFGVTEGGNSVMLLVYNFEPYFYVPLPKNLPFGPDDKELFIQTLNVCFFSLMRVHNPLRLM